MMMMMLMKLRSDEVFAKHPPPAVQNPEQNQTVAFAAKTRRKYFLNKNLQHRYAFSIIFDILLSAFIKRKFIVKLEIQYKEEFGQHSELTLIFLASQNRNQKN